ncbi:MAG: sugar phosphate isomerase/epimerase [Candidatus Glassbacteria bacterium]|nr:sugar phosphate isomerase/epimerase [Candidatus Glassbacteria bacterium]
MTASQLDYFISAPYAAVTGLIDQLGEAGMGVEFELNDPEWILKVCELPAVSRLGRTLRQQGIGRLVQGPFYDLAPGSLDPYIREHTQKLYIRTLDIAAALEAEFVTFFTGYNTLLHARVLDQWFEVCRPLWRRVLDYAARLDVRVLFANMFEDEPEIQLRLLDGLPPELCGVCLDVAGAYAFSKKKITSWVNLLGGRLELVYLSDARVRDSERLPLGAGSFPLKDFYQACMKKSLVPDIVFKMAPEQAFDSLQLVRKKGLGQYQIELL